MARIVNGQSYKDAFEKAWKINSHLHSRERWFGKSGDQSGTDWALEDSHTAFRAISGNGVYGADTNDEALILGTSDTPIIAGMLTFDIHRLLINAVSQDTVYTLRFVYGTGTMAAAITAGQYTTVMVKFDSTNPQLSADIPVDIRIAGLAATTKVWAQAKNATDNATIDFFVGVHEYGSIGS